MLLALERTNNIFIIHYKVYLFYHIFIYVKTLIQAHFKSFKVFGFNTDLRIVEDMGA